MEKRVALIGIIVEDLEQSEQVNALLHTYGNYIIGRMGVPYREREISIISVIIDAPGDVVSALSGKLGSLHGVQAKTMYTKETKPS